jgi:hypothetical protein
LTQRPVERQNRLNCRASGDRHMRHGQTLRDISGVRCINLAILTVVHVFLKNEAFEPNLY